MLAQSAQKNLQFFVQAFTEPLALKFLQCVWQDVAALCLNRFGTTREKVFSALTEIDSPRPPSLDSNPQGIDGVSFDENNSEAFLPPPPVDKGN